MSDTLLKSASIQIDDVERLAEQCQIPRLIARWLMLRGITTETEARTWLDASQGTSLSPNIFQDMPAAVAVLREALQVKKRICVVGDYDVDGVTSSTIVASTLAALGADWCCIIPHRVRDGYGLSLNLVQRAKELGSDVILTVDNGIRAIDAVDAAVEMGMQVIVTDHHEPGDALPERAEAIVHWARVAQDHQTAVSELSGAGVAWKLATALLTELDADHLSKEIIQELMAWHVGLAALGAIADLMPMRGENRVLVRDGIEQLKRCSRPGWLALCEVANVNLEQLNDTRIAWALTPRINAAGRMGHAEVAFRMLMADDMKDAVDAAAQIEAWNRERKKETDRAFEEACARIDQHPDWPTAPMQVVAGPWPLGVVGIVAARIVDKYGVPTIVLADDGTDELRGSGRAPEGFPLHEALLSCTTWMNHFGGHESAIGCAIHRTHVEPFRKAACEAAIQVATALPVEGAAIADDYLSLSDANVETLRWLQRFAPHGPQNPAFTFYVGPVEVVQVTPMSNGQHLRLKVREGRTTADLVWFKAPEEAAAWVPGTTIAAVCRLEENVWQGVVRAQFLVETAHRLESPLTREDFGAVYRLLHARRKLTQADAEQLVKKHRHADATIIFDTFVELGFAQLDESAYHVVEQVVSRDLRDSKHYQAHLWHVARIGH